MSLVCATHFSEEAQRAATAAAWLAKRLGEPLFLVHVLAPESARAFGRALMETAERVLGDEARRLGQLGVEVGYELLQGEPAEEVARFARERDASLVLTAASTHESPFRGLGGTVDRLAHSLPVPLVVVRQVEPFEAWAKGERALKVMLGVDRSLPFEAARDWVRALRRHGPVEVVGGRIFWPHEEYERMGLPRPLVYADATPELRRALEHEAASQVSVLESEGQPPVRVRLEMGLGRVADHLVALAAEEKVDLLVVGNHQRKALGRLWSVSNHAMRLASMSVASVSVAAAQAVEVSIPSVRSVLVATDFSETANRAVPHAFSLLPKGGTVYLVHVGEPKLSAEQQREVAGRLRQLVPAEGESQGRRVEVLVLSGEDVATHLVQAAARLDVDVVCMGTHGRSGLARAVLGSVAEAVMARADRPVLVVRPPAE